MGTWSVSTSGENYIMEYSNGFKRSIRKSQVTKTSKGAIVTYASSQSPNLTLAETIYSIQSYTAGTSSIDFINNGGDDWDISFKISPDSVQSSANIIGYQYYVEHWVSGTNYVIGSGMKTTDYALNSIGNGAGVYQIAQTYLLDNSSFFRCTRLIKVNSSGNIVAEINMQGIIVQSINGLSIVANSNVTQVGVSYPITWISCDNFPPTSLNVIATGNLLNANIPIDSIGLSYNVEFDSVFSNDFPDIDGSIATLSIS